MTRVVLNRGSMGCIVGMWDERSKDYGSNNPIDKWNDVALGMRRWLCDCMAMSIVVVVYDWETIKVYDDVEKASVMIRVMI